MERGRKVGIKAKYGGNCAICKKPIEIGDDIYWYPDTKRVEHVECEEL